MKVLLNKCYGGFCLSEEVYEKLGLHYDGYGFLRNEGLGISSGNDEKFRADPRLISAVEEVGLDSAGGDSSDLVIVDVPEGIDWEITDYDGIETLHEKHRSW